MKTLIIGGGNLDYDFALAFMRENPHDFVIAADKGMEFLRRAKRLPDVIVGDFDSVSPETLAWFAEKKVEIRKFQPQKDSTDMEIAVLMALENGSTQITVLGATGSRMDHMLGSIRNLSLALRAGVPCSIVDAHNRIRLFGGPLTIKKEEQYGKYVSLLAFGEPVTNLTLRGFFYPLDGYTMTCDDAIGVSNQITEDEARITFDGGRLLVIESRD